MRVALDADDGDVDEVGDAGMRCGPDQALRPPYFDLAGPAKGVRGAVHYRVDAPDSLVETRTSLEVSPDRARLPTPAQHPNFAACGAQAVHDPAPERAPSSREQHLRCAHPEPSSWRSGGKVLSFSGLTTMRMARMRPSAASSVVTLVGRPPS